MEMVLLHSTGRHEGGEGGDGWREKHIDREGMAGRGLVPQVLVCLSLFLPAKTTEKEYRCIRVYKEGSVHHLGPAGR